MQEGHKQKHSAVYVSGSKSKTRSYKEQYCIGNWNVRSMDQGKLNIVRQEMARVNIDLLGIKLKWTGTGEFNSDDQYIHYCWQDSHKRSEVALIIKEFKMQYLGAISKMTERSVCFQSKPLNITINQAYTPTTNAEEVEVD